MQDQPESVARVADVQGDDHQGGENVYAGHDRHHLLRHLADAFNAADDDGSHQQGQGDAVPGTVMFQGGEEDHQLVEGLVGLQHVAPADGSAHDGDGEEEGQEQPQLAHESAFFLQSFPQVIHGTARERAVAVLPAVFDAQGHLGKLQ